MRIIYFLLISSSINCAYSQYLGPIVSVSPNTGMQGQSLITTITEPADAWITASPPCYPQDVYMIQGLDTIFADSMSISWNWSIDVRFPIPSNAPIGFYDVYASGSTWDMWWGTCSTIGYWYMQNGFEVLLGSGMTENRAGAVDSYVYPNPARNGSKFFLDEVNPGQKTLTVFNSRGETCYREIFSGEIYLDRKKFTPGIFWYRIETADRDRTWTGKFLIQE